MNQHKIYGKLIRAICWSDIPQDVTAQLPRPAIAIGLLNQKKAIIKSKSQKKIGELMNQLDVDYFDKKLNQYEMMDFWLGYYGNDMPAKK